MFFKQVTDNNDDAIVADKDEDHEPTSIKSKEAWQMKGIANGDNSNFKIGGMSEASAGEEGAGDDHDHDEDGGNYMGE